MFSEEFRKIIAKERKSRGMTFAAFARETGVTERAIAYWEKGERSHSTFDVIEGVLNKLGYEIVVRRLSKK